jgi:hypothetical protein
MSCSEAVFVFLVDIYKVLYIFGVPALLVY